MTSDGHGNITLSPKTLIPIGVLFAMLLVAVPTVWTPVYVDGGMDGAGANQLERHTRRVFRAVESDARNRTINESWPGLFGSGR